MSTFLFVFELADCTYMIYGGGNQDSFESLPSSDTCVCAIFGKRSGVITDQSAAISIELLR